MFVSKDVETFTLTTLDNTDIYFKVIIWIYILFINIKKILNKKNYFRLKLIHKKL